MIEKIANYTCSDYAQQSSEYLNMHVSRRKISILIILHNVSIAQEDSRQRKTITGCNDSLGTLLFFLTALLQRHDGVTLNAAERC